MVRSGELHGCERRAGSGPDQYKEELTGSPREDGTLERLEAIHSLLRPVEVRRFAERTLPHQREQPQTAAKLRPRCPGRFDQADRLEGQGRCRRGCTEWWQGDLDRGRQAEGT